MNGSHIAGGGIGAALAVVLAAVGSRIGLHLSDADAAVLAVALLGAGAGLFHVLGKAWTGAGIFPSIRRGLFGPKAAQASPAQDNPAPPVV